MANLRHSGVEATSPAPAGNLYGKTTKRVYDSVGRLERDSVYVNTTEHSYVRYEYPANGVQSKTYAPLVDVDGDGNIAEDEVYSESWTDGAGRIRMARTEHPGSAGGWAATLVEYDILGRVKRQSVPTETDASYNPAGDDATRGFLWTHRKYDWMGRVVRRINTDGVDQTALNDSDVLISYEGCGCAGGLVTTVEGELVPRTDTTGSARRRQKSYADILGRAFKTETYEWDGTTVYSSVVQSFDGADRPIRTRQYAGDTSGTTYQDTTASFDGHGRLHQSHRPEQRDYSDNLKYTTYSYNPDDSVLSITDGRGAVTNLTYNSRGLLTQKSWSVPTGSSDLVEEIGSRYVSTDDIAVHDFAAKEGAFDLMFEATGYSPIVFDAMQALAKNGVLVLSSVTGGDRRVEVPADKLNLEFVLGNKVMVGTVNANREYFESGVQDMSAAVLEYGDWLSKLLTHPVDGLENYQKLFELLTNGKDVIKVFCEVAPLA